MYMVRAGSKTENVACGGPHACAGRLIERSRRRLPWRVSQRPGRWLKTIGKSLSVNRPLLCYLHAGEKD